MVSPADSSSSSSSSSPPLSLSSPLSLLRPSDAVRIPIFSPRPVKGRSATSYRKRRPKRFRAKLPSAMMLFITTLLLFACHARGVLVSTFDNCLSDFTKKSPSHLQFHPILVAANFDPVGQDENYLDLTVWGTVTGASSSTPNQRTPKRDLPNIGQSGLGVPFGPLDHDTWRQDLLERRQINGTDLAQSDEAPPTFFGGSYKANYHFPTDSIDYNFTGSIVDQDRSWNQIATTLTTNIVIASFTVYKNRTFFCKNPAHDNSVNATCPFGNLISAGNTTSDNRTEMMDSRLVPDQFRNNVTYLVQELPSFTIHRRLSSNYQFATMGVTIKILSGDVQATQVGCVHVELTPVLNPSYNKALTWVSAGILILMGVASLLAAIFNPWNGTTDIFRFSSNIGMDRDMLRLVTPGFADCLQWLQFIVLTGGLSLSYPGFYQPVVANGAWSALLLNTSLYSHVPDGAEVWRADGLYAPQAWALGYERLAQLVGLLTVNDIWVSVLVWFTVLLAGLVVLFQLWFWGRWVLRLVIGIEEQDLTNRNWPFTIGTMFRLAFTYFVVPLVAACTFQFTVANRSSTALTSLAALVLVALLGGAVALTYVIWNYRPRAALFDDLPALLTYGTFYNTFREKCLSYFVVQLYINILRGIAFGALQPSGIAQVTILSVCEIVMVLTLYGVKPYYPETSMNLWHIIFSIVRLLTILLMMAFVPSINATDAVKSWIGWILLGIHAVVLIFAFALKAMQTLLELAVRGYRNDEEASRGGFAKVFGVRQLSRRKRHSKQTHRSSSTPISIADHKHTPPHIAHSRSNSGAMLGLLPTDHTGLITPHDGSQSGQGHSNSGSTAAGLTPTTPRTIGGGYGYLPPIVRPPRTRRTDGEQSSPAGHQSHASWASDLWAKNRSSQGSEIPTVGGPVTGVSDDTELEETQVPPEHRADTPTSAVLGSHRYTDSAVTVGSGRGKPDYAVREVDSYYRVRGPALSAQPQRRLGTGPADPTGPISTAKSWIKTKLGLARGEKEKGFSVVRSSRAPDAILDAQREVERERELSGEDPEGAIGVALTSLDDEPHGGGAGDSESDATSDATDAEEGPSTRMLEDDGAGHVELPRRPGFKPLLPRKSSKRKSRNIAGQQQQQLYDPPIHRGSSGRLPFEEVSVEKDERKDDDRSRSISTIGSILEPPPLTIDGRPPSVGEVHHGRVGAVVRDERGDIRGSRAELVRGGSSSSSSRGGGQRGS